ncbi:MAG: HdeD family acid-resistance protein [Actinomycetes bacterium]
MPAHTATDRSTSMAGPKAVTHLWWVPLLLGVAWLIIALAVLQFDIGSVETIALLFGIFLLAAGVDELAAVALAPGWRWLHAALGALFVVGGVAALVWPDVTFAVAAHLVAWFLLAKGMSDVIIALSLKHELELWGLTLVAGILEIGVAFWAVGYSGRSAALLILWVGFGAVAKGITNILVAFQVRALGREVAAGATTVEEPAGAAVPPQPSAGAPSGAGTPGTPPAPTP